MSKKNTTIEYLDLNLYANYWGNHGYHHTASASLHYALREALRIAYEEGLKTRYAHHRENANLLRAGLQEIGAPPFIPAEYRLPPLTTAAVPDGIEPHALRAKLLNEKSQADLGR